MGKDYCCYWTILGKLFDLMSLNLSRLDETLGSDIGREMNGLCQSINLDFMMYSINIV